jgi:hypothetical protein
MLPATASLPKATWARQAALVVTVKARVPERRLSGESTHATAHQDRDTWVGVVVLTHCRMGELEPWIDENFVRSIWYNMGETVNVKMIRDKFSG